MTNTLPHRQTYPVLLLTLLSWMVTAFAFGGKKGTPMLDVRVYAPKPQDRQKLRRREMLSHNHITRPFVDVRVSQTEFQNLTREGFTVSILTNARRNTGLPLIYTPYNEVEDEIFQLRQEFPEIVHVEQIGNSTHFGLPIWAVKISDNAARDEDEPAILFQGLHHARELIGVNVCLALLRKLCHDYKNDKEVTKWVDSTEIWVLPVLNPDGYKYVFEHDLGFPWWRKNLRDNDGDGRFDPLEDGVDLNRNYDYNWRDGGDGRPESWFFRGKLPFSEKETQAIKDLAVRENFVIGISYHSYGESILYPWGNYKEPPDIDLILDIAGKMAEHMHRLSGQGHYLLLPLDGRVGQSSIWMYGKLRVLDYIVEVGTEHIPQANVVPAILAEQLKGAFYLLRRLDDTGITGHVFDATTRKPLRAEIHIKELAADYVSPRRSDPEFGRYDRMLLPGTYTIEVTAAGYAARTFNKVRIKRNQLKKLDVALQPN